MSGLTKFFKDFLPTIYVLVATILIITGNVILSTNAFTIATALQVFGFAVLISVIAFVIWAAFVITFCRLGGFNKPGLLFVTLFGALAGSLSLRLVSYFFPAAVHFPSLLTAAPTALIVTLLTLMLGFLTGAIKGNVRFLFTRHMQ
jgi:hypothetical protein